MIRVLALALAAGVLSNVVGDTAAQVAAVAAGVAGAIYLYRNVVRPFGHLVRRALRSYEVLEIIGRHVGVFESLDGRLDGLERRLEAVEAKTDAAREPAEALARELGVRHRSPGSGLELPAGAAERRAR